MLSRINFVANLWLNLKISFFMKINSVLVGKGRGKIGNVIGGVWKGIPYLRQAPETVANPRTPAQTKNRDYMKVIGFWSKGLKRFNDIVWKTKSIKMSATNAWASAQRTKGQFVLSQDGYPSAIALGGLEIYNVDAPPSSMSATLAGGNLVLSIAGLPSNRSYQTCVIAQSNEYEFDVSPILGNSSNGSGVLTETVIASSFLLTDIAWAYFAVVDEVSGQVYAYSAEVQ